MPDTRPKKGVWGGGGGIGTGKNPDEWTLGNLKFHHELLRALVHAPFTWLFHDHYPGIIQVIRVFLATISNINLPFLQRDFPAPARLHLLDKREMQDKN